MLTYRARLYHVQQTIMLNEKITHCVFETSEDNLDLLNVSFEAITRVGLPRLIFSRKQLCSSRMKEILQLKKRVRGIRSEGRR